MGLLPGWEVMHVFEWDVLLRNARMSEDEMRTYRDLAINLLQEVEEAQERSIRSFLSGFAFGLAVAGLMLWLFG
jgi:hypothetical protein